MPRVNKKAAASASTYSGSRSTRREDYTFFWTPTHVNGWASQWYPASFTEMLTIEPDSPPEAIHFPTTEHYMMLSKALLFSSPNLARQIIAITKTDKRSMAKVKALGRKVPNFNDVTWGRHRERLVREGNLAKFRQNEDLMEKLLATRETEIVEAAPRDRVWGIGFGEKNALERGRIERWGLNLLGKALVEVRSILKEEEEENAKGGNGTE